MIPGVDVSNWQGPPGDWRGIAEPYDWAAVKFTEFYPDGSRYLNPVAGADWEFLREQKKGRIGFLFAHPAASTAETVAYFTAAIRGAGITDADAVMVDLEQTDGRNPAQVSVWARIVLRALQAEFQRLPLLYTYLSFGQTGNCTGLAPWPLYISEPDSPPGRPTLPAPWRTWAIHQTSITSPIDRDVANYPDLAAMTRALGKTTPAAADLLEDPMLLNRSAGAVTPIALPATCKRVRFFTAEGSAALTWQLVADPVNHLTLSLNGGSKVIDIPDDKHAVCVTRLDGGSNDVSFALET